MSKIVSLNPDRQLSFDERSEPDPNLIERLEKLLEQAKSGELQVLGYGAVNSDGSLTHGWVTQTRFDAMTLIGALNIACVDMANGCIDED